MMPQDICRAVLVAFLSVAVSWAQQPGDDAFDEPIPAPDAQPQPSPQPPVAMGPVAGFEQVGGPLPKVVKNTGKPYLVVADIQVPANRMVTIEPGVVLLFRNFTGVHVQGKLVAEGTRTKPIVFTSEFDTVYNPSSGMIPNPFDWDGIYIHDDAIGTMLTYCKVAFSVYGIKSDTKFIRIQPAVFHQNGKGDLTIEGVEHTVGSKPYSFVLDEKDAMVDGVPVNLLRDPAAPRRNTLRYVGLAAALVGIGVGIYEATQWNSSQDQFDQLSSLEFDNLNSGSEQQWEDARTYRNRDIVYALSCFGVGLIGAVGFTWSFTF